MKLKKFVGKSLNGYLDFDLRFNDDLTFVTGINGTGKTTALNAMSALLMPRIDYLATHEFNRVAITVEIDSKTFTISCKKTSSSTTLECSQLPEASLELFAFDIDPDQPRPRQVQEEEEFYRHQLSTARSNPIISFILNLPTPMYLGLDRRVVSVENDSRVYPSFRSSSRSQSIFGRSLSQSLNSAKSHAQKKFRNTVRLKHDLDLELREELVLDLLNFPPIVPNEMHSLPSNAELKQLDDARKNLIKLPELLNIGMDKILPKLDPLFDYLDSTVETLKKARDQATQRSSLTEDQIQAVIGWSQNKPQINKINSISKKIKKYNSKTDILFSEINNFLSNANSFISDSGKRLRFDNFGELNYQIKKDKTPRNISTLSSGEIQMIIILSHLHFNDEVDNANIFIIDEPELSLHVQWQEKFVDAVMQAAPNVQFILATHSPSIIQEKTNFCIEIEDKK